VKLARAFKKKLARFPQPVPIGFRTLAGPRRRESHIAMKSSLLALAALCALSPLAPAQEVLPIERAREIAGKINERAGRIEDAPLAVDPDLDRPQGIHADKVGIMVVPDRTLSIEKLSELGTPPVPLGQLWLRNAAISDMGSPISAAQLRTVYIPREGEDVSVQLYLLGTAKNAAGKTELLIYGKAKDPIARAPLTAISASPQGLPLELAGHKESDDSGILTINILGKYSADLRLVRPPE